MNTAALADSISERFDIVSFADAYQFSQYCKRIAVEKGVTDTKASTFAIAVSEIAINAVRYGTNAKAIIESVENKGGIKVTISDCGNGIPDLKAAFADGYTTFDQQSLGVGLSTAKRCADEFIVNYNDETGVSISLSVFLPPVSKTLAIRAISFPAIDKHFNNDKYFIKYFDGIKALVVVMSVALKDKQMEGLNTVECYIQSNFRLSVEQVYNDIDTLLEQLCPSGFDLFVLNISDSEIAYQSSKHFTTACFGKSSSTRVNANDGLMRVTQSISGCHLFAIGSAGINFLALPDKGIDTEADVYELASFLFNKCAVDDKDATLLVAKVCKNGQ
ncbi:ATP-binding protein [Alteromonas sp. 009811495]|uniref:ATP-binding protein n=1 Tax=Alteromonas sp. 009811495 TaxID=3002962 RepID=UPI00237EE1FF|nr:ATP-binding protein [Alteromonas sp. 009811495]WDT84581.1 ATP-binding protein [Alteromonas sp. 009811495]